MPPNPRNRRRLRYPPISEQVYRDFLQEIKVIERAPFQLEFHEVGGRIDPLLPAHSFQSQLLPEAVREDLSISGWSDEFFHFTIYAGVDNYDYLLRGEIAHPGGPFVDQNGTQRGPDQPHYHEIDYSSQAKGKWGTRRVVLEHLVPRMEADALLGSFVADYNFTTEDLKGVQVVRVAQAKKEKTLLDF